MRPNEKVGTVLKILLYPSFVVFQPTQHSLSEAAQLQIGVVEGLFHLFVEQFLFSANENRRATVENSFGRALHDHEVSSIVRIFSFVDRDLP